LLPAPRDPAKPRPAFSLRSASRAEAGTLGATLKFPLVSGVIMNTVFDYRRRADQCRNLATEADADLHDELLRMADEWEHLVCERLALLRSNPDLAAPGELDENAARYDPEDDLRLAALH
jgi:hypothetical protein